MGDNVGVAVIADQGGVQGGGFHQVHPMAVVSLRRTG